MRFLSTRAHGMLDYLVGVILIVAPGLFGLAGAAAWIMMILGAGAIVYSLLTRYELGLVGLIPMNVHLRIDMASGVLLAASPFLFGFAGTVWLPHVVFGLFEIGASLVTRRQPGSARGPR